MTEARLSVIIPALEAAASLPAALRALEEAAPAGLPGGLIEEVIVVDGGSRDGSERVAAALGARVVHQAGGRGPQLAAGAAGAAGDWLLFLHADTCLAPGWSDAVRVFMAERGNRARAAVFRLCLDDPDPRARRIERWAGWRARVLGLPYGDQGLVIQRDFYRSLGGFPPIPLMEDVSFLRRVGRRRLVHLEADARTSAQRYRRDGWWTRPALNLTLLGLYFLGAPPAWLKRLYG